MDNGVECRPRAEFGDSAVEGMIDQTARVVIDLPVKLPFEDRSLTLYPSRYRWLGGDATGRSQTSEEAAGKKP